VNHTVKSLEAGRIGGYLIAWGDTAQRDLEGEFFTPETELGLTWYDQRPMLYHHGLDNTMKASVIGVIDTLYMDEIGVWAEGQLDLRRDYVQTVQRLVRKGVLNWSSGSLPHLVDVAVDGEIKRWPIVEGSLTPTPAEPRRTNVNVIKSAYAALGLQTTQLNLEGDMMETTTKRLPLRDADDARKTPRITVSSPFDSLEALDMVHGYVMLRSAKSFQGVSERYANALMHKIERESLPVGEVNGTKTVTGDLNATIVTGYGDDWVPDMWSREIWRRARQDNVILPLFRAIEMPSNPFELPIDGNDPTVYYVPETKDESQLTLGAGNPIPDSKFGSGKVQLKASKLALRVGFSAELVEDAIIPVLNLYREQAMRAITDSIDDVLLNGDTDNLSNINTNGTPLSTDRYLALDGLRKQVLVNNTSLSSAFGGGTLALSDLRTTRFSLPDRQSTRPNDLAWIVDGGTYAKVLGFSEFLTMDKAGPLATARTGQIGMMDGAPVFVSAQMPQTSSTGQVGVTNDKGTALCVFRPGWMVGYRRRIAVDVSYLPYYDSYQLTATVRLAFAPMDNKSAAALYNI
jgi:HK97 family phage major capsid protein